VVAIGNYENERKGIRLEDRSVWKDVREVVNSGLWMRGRQSRAKKVLS
jgi:hypothetical protein